MIQIQLGKEYKFCHISFTKVLYHHHRILVISLEMKRAMAVCHVHMCQSSQAKGYSVSNVLHYNQIYQLKTTIVSLLSKQPIFKLLCYSNLGFARNWSAIK